MHKPASLCIRSIPAQSYFFLFQTKKRMGKRAYTIKSRKKKRHNENEHINEAIDRRYTVCAVGSAFWLMSCLSSLLLLSWDRFIPKNESNNKTHKKPERHNNKIGNAHAVETTYTQV